MVARKLAPLGCSDSVKSLGVLTADVGKGGRIGVHSPAISHNKVAQTSVTCSSRRDDVEPHRAEGKHHD